jgi:tetratricopeptide (TPR) repeat protein
MLEAEGHGRSKDLLQRIGREADGMWHLDQWKTGRLKDAAGWMAALHPLDGQKAVAAALGRDARDLERAHRGRLAAMMALSYFDNADPVNCIRWAQIASQSIDEPLVWQAAYLGLTLWSQRSQRIGTAFQLEKQFAVLDGVNRFFETESVHQFTQAARARFAADQAAGRLTWPVRWRLLWLLDRHDAHDRQQMVALLEANVATNPADASQWRLLADLHALDEDPGARAQALAGAWSADPRHAATALAWASACVVLDDLQQVERILEAIDPAKVRHESGYYFCLAALAEWKNKPRAALEHYARATDLCRYRPEYFRRYGRLLMAQGDAEAAKKAIAWATRIDSGGRGLPAARGDGSQT